MNDLCKKLEESFYYVFHETPLVGNGAQFRISDVKKNLDHHQDLDDVVDILYAVEKHKIWADDGSGLVDVGKLMVSWKAAIRDCKDRGLEM